MKAVLVGINYATTKYRLNGCIQDVESVSDLLYQVYGVTSITRMTDNVPVQSKLYPTKENILRTWREMILSLSKDDAGFIHYSGHGKLGTGNSMYTQREIEERGMGCMIVPSDAVSKDNDIVMANMIYNHELWELCNLVPVGARLFVVVDACHSGSLLELPYMLKLGVSQTPRSFGKSVCSLVRSEDHHAEGGSVILLSACAEDESSADTTYDGKPSGALTKAFCSTLKQYPTLTPIALAKAVHTFMKSHLPKTFKQTPQISFSHMVDCTQPFKIGTPVVRARHVEVVPALESIQVRDLQPLPSSEERVPTDEQGHRLCSVTYVEA